MPATLPLYAMSCRPGWSGRNRHGEFNDRGVGRDIAAAGRVGA